MSDSAKMHLDLAEKRGDIYTCSVFQESCHFLVFQTSPSPASRISQCNTPGNLLYLNICDISKGGL